MFLIKWEVEFRLQSNGIIKNINSQEESSNSM